MSLETLANLAEIFGVLVVIGGLLFAFVEIAQYRQQRRETAALELARSFQTPEFAHALRVVLSLPDGLGAAALRREGPEVEDAAMLVSLTLESVGIMVHRRIVPADMVWELMGGVVLTAWDKLEGWIRDVRVEQDRAKFDEWIEWLSTHLRRHFLDRGVEPAYVRYAAWAPGRGTG
ncbi:MAG: DUF4760 domain-containing protein [Gemmatimonadetes bacterium]|nr:DUF4760 domain-containing protein [Gemmatimonadota bacterium]NIQ56457.1 DUF4760 domain-containing protein [Gemmatimonadota bacterium]NIU76646.1 DUF4760 domain-containing protein [Gammaproteobacteria bacterium]NIX46086.1 DUF4760 domain-containing protein [Gemmatimonadota bacterium]NIY10409.1 DUF4760 domain-containing protein [Gemmatimonadota bacterium]